MTIYSEELIEDFRFFTWLSTDPLPNLASVWAPTDGDIGFEKDTKRYYQWNASLARWEVLGRFPSIVARSQGPFTITANGTTDATDVIAAAIKIPGGLLLENSKWELDLTWSYTAPGIAKTMKLAWNATPVVGGLISTVTVSAASQVVSAFHIKGWNAGSRASQKIVNNPTGPVTQSANALQSKSMNTENDSYLVLYAAWASNAPGESIILEEWDLTIKP